MERINLNLPAAARVKIRKMAKRAHLTEGEYVRSLILSSLQTAERELLREAIAASRTPAARARDREIAEAISRLRG